MLSSVSNTWDNFKVSWKVCKNWIRLYLSKTSRRGNLIYLAVPTKIISRSQTFYLVLGFLGLFFINDMQDSGSRRSNINQSQIIETGPETGESQSSTFNWVNDETHMRLDMNWTNHHSQLHIYYFLSLANKYIRQPLTGDWDRKSEGIVLSAASFLDYPGLYILHRLAWWGLPWHTALITLPHHSYQ